MAQPNKSFLCASTNNIKGPQTGWPKWGTVIINVINYTCDSLDRIVSREKGQLVTGDMQNIWCT